MRKGTTAVAVKGDNVIVLGVEKKSTAKLQVPTAAATGLTGQGLYQGGIESFVQDQETQSQARVTEPGRVCTRTQFRQVWYRQQLQVAYIIVLGWQGKTAVANGKVGVAIREIASLDGFGRCTGVDYRVGELAGAVGGVGPAETRVKM